MMTGNPWIDAIAWTVAALWVLSALLTRRGVRALWPLDDNAGTGSDGAPAPPLPRVSIVVASRDEEEHVSEALGSLLALDYPDFEVIAVNDRSRDRTGEMLDALARTTDRLRVAHVKELPQGWLGKCHALSRGVEAATGEWILFTDGDVRFHPGVLGLAVRRALNHELDLLSLLPRLDARSVWMRGFYLVSIVGLVLFLGLWAHTRRRQSLVGMGAGAFILVRRSAYERAGGHAAIRMRVVDDITLAMKVRGTGGRTEIALGVDWLLVPWGVTISDLLKVSRKNGFAVFGYSWTILLTSVVVLTAANVAPPFFFVWDLRLWPASLVVWLAIAEIYRLVAPHARQSAAYFLLHPFVVLLAMLPGINSAIAVTREGGVRWRDSFYPLADLKRAL